VLVVDDDPLQRKLSQIWLQGGDSKVAVAEDGQTALGCAHNLLPHTPRDRRCRRDDVRGWMDFALCLALRSDAESQTRVVWMTSAAYARRQIASLQGVGASALIAKAIGPEAVMTAVSAALESPPSTPDES